MCFFPLCYFIPAIIPAAIFVGKPHTTPFIEVLRKHSLGGYYTSRSNLQVNARKEMLINSNK